MKSGKAKIGIFQKMRIKNLRRGSVRFDLKKLESFTWEMSKNHLIRIFFCATGACGLRNKFFKISDDLFTMT